MQAIWNESLKIRSYDVGLHGLLKPHAIFQYFQEVAGNHATHLGLGYDDLQSHGLFWILSRVKIKIGALPMWGSEVGITTWPKGVDKLFALRDFRMTDSKGEVLVSGTSGWLLVDTKRMRPQRIESIPRPFPINDQEHAIEGPLDKVQSVGELTVVYERRVMASDLDINNHVNNTEYIRWIVDSCDPAQRLNVLQVNYLEEALLGDTIAFSTGSSDDNGSSLYIEGVNRATGKKVVQAKAEFGN